MKRGRSTEPTSEQAWVDLALPWRLAFEQAWRSWCDGNLGIGAALIDPATAAVVSVGRNRVSERVDDANTLSGTFMAHAEMNAFAASSRFKADGLHLYTTLEPCVMCAATSLFLHVEHVFYAAADEFFSGVDELWPHHPYTERWQPGRTGPRTDRLTSFARLLPLVVTAATAPGGRVMAVAREHIPDVVALALELEADGTLRQLAAVDAPIDDALREIWERLPGPVEG